MEIDSIMTYTKWEDIPDGIATKTTLNRDYGLNLAKGQKPVAQKKRYNHRGKHVGYYDLYDVNEAVPKKKATEAQLLALEKARYMADRLVVKCSKCQEEQWRRYNAVKVTRKQWIDDKYDEYVCKLCKDRELAVKWAKSALRLDNAVILDTETTDLNGEIIEIAVIDFQGNVILDERIKPIGEINTEAEQIHGISLDMLKDCPIFPEVYNSIKTAIKQKTVIIYNAAFDIGRLNADCKRHDLEPIQFESACAMEWYAQYFGDWSDYWDSYRWQPLNGTHGALGDCKATLELIKEMV